MKKINWEDVVTLSCFVLLYIIGFWSGCSQGQQQGFDKGVKVTADYADSSYQDQINQCDSILKQAVYYRNMYREKYDSLNHKSK